MRRSKQVDILSARARVGLLSLFLLVSFSTENFHIVEALSSPSTPFGKTTKNVATQVLQGTGPNEVDLNRYNLPLDVIEREWTANLVQKINEQEMKAKLGARTDTEIYVDTVQVAFPRRPENPGLGLELVELAGGREDGLGITVIAGLVEGGSAAMAAAMAAAESTKSKYPPEAIMPGDSIAQVSIVRQKRGGNTVLEDSEEEIVVQTECLSYDATVQAIQSLPPPSDKYEEYYALRLKRLRRKPKVTVKLQFPPDDNEPDATIELFAGENLRYGMLMRGVKLNDPLAKRFDTKNGGNCGAGGLCRTCSVSVLQGAELLNPQRLAEKQMLADNPRWRLACKAIVGYGMKEGEMTLRVNPRQW